MTYWILVVAKNAAKHLTMTLDSLTAQTLRPERIVIVDDGSTDATPGNPISIQGIEQRNSSNHYSA